MNKIFFSFLALLVFSTYAEAQTYVLLDRRWRKPALLTDTVTRTNLSDGWFPIYKSEFDSIAIMVDNIKDLRKHGINRKFFYSEDFKTTHAEFQIENIRRMYADGYEINLISKGPFGSVSLKLSDPTLLLPDNEKTIRFFSKYLYRVIDKQLLDK